MTASPPDPVRVLVADDGQGVRDLLVLLLNMESSFTVVGQAPDWRDGGGAGAEAPVIAKAEMARDSGAATLIAKRRAVLTAEPFQRRFPQAGSAA